MSFLIENQEEILSNYILNPDILINENDLKILPRHIDLNLLLNVSKCPASTTLKPERDIFTGRVINFIEIPINHADENARNSTSIRRAPGSIEESIRGSSMNLPFWPAGLEEPSLALESMCIDDFEFDEDIRLTVPPGFTNGIDFVDDEQLLKKGDDDHVNLITALENNIVSDEWMQISRDSSSTNENIEGELLITNESPIDDVLDRNNQNTVLEISKCSKNVINQYKWAEIVDVTEPVLDFKERIPEPAMTFPFPKLDNFQQHAILKLENQQFVFVAAHTSAGKTVIAEYAIALSQNHMTKTIYTSPIKALSNQKYRDFKETFKDVGLITGDLQIEPKASCLIMTTEILRSMLFCGSDVIRDIEFVIFDEVHYINDESRGHVWEEVIVMLPGHVKIIMLSATVPNPLELANWVGTIKERKVYVITTNRRPVPLLHHLYLDSSGKGKNDLHLVVDANGNFKHSTYEMLDKKIKADARKRPNGEKTILNTLIKKLKADEKLPVVVFTLSRNRCDQNIELLNSLDLNTGSEQAIVHKSFEKWVLQLKPADRELKQVLILKDSLKRGIGVHHSGILPILKEIVEMLFQKGLVKVLFATETFAMGVNMPARTVVFDSIRKFSGSEKRNIKPSEYTQMAGRAGRRGHDENGTVIIMSKYQLPTADELKIMILGQPERLQSKFILRYAVILKCLRNERYKVEGIIENSFMEFEIKNRKPQTVQRLEKAKEKRLNLGEIGENLKHLMEFYDCAFDYLRAREKLMKTFFESNMKKFSTGKILIVTTGHHYNKLGILLSVKIQSSKETILKVLILDHQNKTQNLDEPLKKENDSWHKMVSLIRKHQSFSPSGASGHCVVDIKISDIVHITKSQVKVDPDMIIKNCEMRLLPRFKDAPPAQAVQNAIAELKILNDSNPDNIENIEIQKDKTKLEHNYIFTEFEICKKKLNDALPHTDIANFEVEFSKIFEIKEVEYEIVNLSFLNSKENLSLYPDYCAKLDVLRNLKYIDENEEVTFKGTIACNMGQNELFITELILGNVFNDLDSAEIAALLSGLVFQAKTRVEITPPTIKIKTLMEKFNGIKQTLETAESNCPWATSIVDLNFGLIEVVYEWARNKPFAEITPLTDIQEGIIVRCIQQLDETIQDIKKAAKVIGNPTLQSKMTDTSTAIKRDIVFTPSLYTAT